MVAFKAFCKLPVVYDTITLSTGPGEEVPWYPEQADAAEVRHAHGPREGARDQHAAAPRAGHRPRLREGHRGAQLLGSLRRHVQ